MSKINIEKIILIENFFRQGLELCLELKKELGGVSTSPSKKTQQNIDFKTRLNNVIANRDAMMYTKTKKYKTK